MKMMLTDAKNKQSECEHQIVKKAYDYKIKNFKDTIMYLES